MISGKINQEIDHELLSFQEIKKHFLKYGLNNEFEAEAVAEVAYAHADEKEKSIFSLDRGYGVDSIDRKNTLDLQFLGALLRIADEIDNAFTSVIEIPNQASSGRQLIRFVNIDPQKWIIEFHHHAECIQEEAMILSLVQSAQKKLCEVKDILERRKLFYWIVQPRPQLSLNPQYSEVLSKISHEKVRSKYLKRLVDNYRYIDVRGIQVGKIVRIKLEDVFIPLKVVPYEGFQESDTQGFFKNEQIRCGDKNGTEDQIQKELISKIKAELKIPTGDQLWSSISQISENAKEPPIVKKPSSKGMARAILIDNILEYPRVVILGHPGSGKTTLTKFLAVAAATGSISVNGNRKILLPIVIPIRAYADDLEKNPELSISKFLPLFFGRVDFRGVDELGRFVAI